MFSYGYYTQDSSARTQVMDFRCPIRFDNVWVNSGDTVFGDTDGVLIIPQKYGTGVFEKASEKAAGGKVVRKVIEGGMTVTAASAKSGTL